METKNGLSQEDLLRLASLGEVFGGFAHEIAQPLNAIMIASQVVQLKVERRDLPEEEKKFVVHRLNIVTSQVQKASEIVESLRLFSGASFSGSGETGLKGIFEKVYGLMGQQFISRGIELKCECDEALPSIRNNPNLFEGVMVQGLAFARDAVAALGVWHDQRNIPYKKFLTVKFTEQDGACAADILWDSGGLPADMTVMDAQNHTGLATAGTVLFHGGRLESPFSFEDTFPEPTPSLGKRPKIPGTTERFPFGLNAFRSAERPPVYNA
jgi:nitrogen-specific signal transduction histidine kinase